MLNYFKIIIIKIFDNYIILGNGDWGLGIGDWAQSPIPNPQSPKLFITLLFFIFNKQLFK